MPTIVKVAFKGKRADDLRDYIGRELADVIGSRGGLERKWEDSLVAWKAALPGGVKDFPYPNSSNLVFPLTPIHADPILADFTTTLGAPEDYWGVTDKRPDRVTHAKPTQKFLTALDREHTHIREVNVRACLDQIVLGKAIYKNHWDRRKASVLSRDGKSSIRVLSKPAIDHVPLQHFYIPPDAWSIDPDAPVGGAQWVAEKVYRTVAELKARIAGDAAGYEREKVDSILKWMTAQRDTVDEQIRALDEYPIPHYERVELFEVHVRFDANGDDVPEDIVLLWHQGIQDWVRAIYEPFLHGKRPYHATGYLPGFGFYDVSLTDQDEWAQLTLTKMLNALIDNLMIANTIMVAGPQGAMFSPNEPLYPGRYFPLGPDEKIQSIMLGQVNPSIPNTIAQFLNWAELRTGQSELRGGNVSSLPSRTPATTIMEMLRMGNKRFDMILSNTRAVHGEIGLRLLQNVAQEYQDVGEVMRWQNFCKQALGDADAQKVAEVLASEIPEIAASLGVSVTATSALVNKEAEKQSLIGMMQVVLPMYQQLVQTGMMMSNPQVPDLAKQAAAASFSAGVELIARLLERFDISNPSQYLGNLEALSGALSAQSQGANPATAGLQPGMAPAGAIAQPMSPFPQPGFPQQMAPQQAGSLFGL